MPSDVDPEVVVAVVALLVSLVALAATFMQVMQQYYASAAGYAQCNEKVMGKWALTKSRRFSWDELRFEVEFEAPVIFVSPPDNEHGPIREAKIYFLDGTKESLENTWSELDYNPRDEYANKSKRERIHTADNERASWTLLLSAVQRMERESGNWQESQYKDMRNQSGPPTPESHLHDLPPEPPSLYGAHTLTVALQRKRKSWDTMPSTVVRPYATTTMCHLIEMLAALGIYWKEFDRKHDRYRAEGNGFMVLGEKVTDLGLMFTFSIYGRSRFESNRVIPVDQIKELCFGYVSTIYSVTLDQRRLRFPEDDPENLAFLQLATRNEISETLIRIGCNNNAVRAFQDPGRHTSHLFPVAFEILGMLSRTFHIKDSMFTHIPNPTPERWDKRSVSLVKVMEAYQDLAAVELPGAHRNPVITEKIKKHGDQILEHNPEDQTIAEKMCLLKALHEAIDDCDQILTARGSIPTPRAERMPETGPQKSRREVVQDVLRSHIQEVLRLLNDGDDRISDTQSLHAEWSPAGPGHPRVAPNRFEDMHEASPDERQHKFMEVYFHVVRPNVVPRATRSTDRRSSIVGGAPPGHGFRRTGTGRTQASSVRGMERPPSPVPPVPHLQTGGGENIPMTSMPNGRPSLSNRPGSSAGDSVSVIGSVRHGLIPLNEEAVSHDDLWCTLIFRMICWLMLHDFNKLDVQVSKSELLGSRMPVYIS
ncbi:Modin [Fusarium albosuccineum]|uniref:Modin n=1 Tax=Fusarium albosuccineum TaxID=1237068 RepID=A0A8H4LPY2_9HYPO|nr:Modin [Fusarium albosuccineum]